MDVLSVAAIPLQWPGEIRAAASMIRAVAMQLEGQAVRVGGATCDTWQGRTAEGYRGLLPADVTLIRRLATDTAALARIADAYADTAELRITTAASAVRAAKEEAERLARGVEHRLDEAADAANDLKNRARGKLQDLVDEVTR